MATLLKGFVQNDPDFAYKGAKETPVLKFRLQIGDNWFKRQDIVAFGPQAEACQDLQRGETVQVSGELKENNYFADNPKMELIVGWKGNIRRYKDVPLREMLSPDSEEDDADGLASAPRSYRRRSYAPEGSVDISDCPEIEWPDPTDEEYEEAIAYWNSLEFPRGGFLLDDDNEPQ